MTNTKNTNGTRLIRRFSKALLTVTSGAFLLAGPALSQEPGAQDRPSATAPGTTSPVDPAKAQTSPAGSSGDKSTPAATESRDRDTKSGFNRPNEKSPYRNPSSLTETQSGNPPSDRRGSRTNNQALPAPSASSEAGSGPSDRPNEPTHTPSKPYTRPGQLLAPNQQAGDSSAQTKTRRPAKDEGRPHTVPGPKPEHPNELTGPNRGGSADDERLGSNSGSKRPNDEAPQHRMRNQTPTRPNTKIAPNGSAQLGTDAETAERQHRPDEPNTHHNLTPAQPSHRDGPGHRSNGASGNNTAMITPNPRVPNPQSKPEGLPNPQSSTAMPNPQSNSKSLPNPQGTSAIEARTGAAPAAAPSAMPSPQSAPERPEPAEHATPAPVEHAPPEPAHAAGH